MSELPYRPGLGVELALIVRNVHKPGHHLTLVPEEPAPGHSSHGTEFTPTDEGVTVRRVRGSYAVPILRAVCSCGWKATEAKRYTIEENAIWWWQSHHIDRLGGGVR